MARAAVGEIRINKRIIQFGHEVYPLANISRVQMLELVWSGRLSTFRPLRKAAVLLVLAGAVIWAALDGVPRLDTQDFDANEGARQVALWVAVGAGTWIALLLIVFCYRLLVRGRRYALVIETAGTQYTALTGSDYHEINRIKSEIVAAIEDPPAFERVVHISGDVVVGDKVGRDKNEQVGTGNRMIFNR